MKATASVVHTSNGFTLLYTRLQCCDVSIHCPHSCTAKCPSSIRWQNDEDLKTRYTQFLIKVIHIIIFFFLTQNNLRFFFEDFFQFRHSFKSRRQNFAPQCALTAVHAISLLLYPCETSNQNVIKSG